MHDAAHMTERNCPERTKPREQSFTLGQTHESHMVTASMREAIETGGPPKTSTAPLLMPGQVGSGVALTTTGPSERLCCQLPPPGQRGGAGSGCPRDAGSPGQATREEVPLRAPAASTPPHPTCPLQPCCRFRERRAASTPHKAGVLGSTSKPGEIALLSSGRSEACSNYFPKKSHLENARVGAKAGALCLLQSEALKSQGTSSKQPLRGAWVGCGRSGGSPGSAQKGRAVPHTIGPLVSQLAGEIEH